MFSEARAKQTRFPDANAISFKRIAMKANLPPQAAKTRTEHTQEPVKTQILPEGPRDTSIEGQIN